VGSASALLHRQHGCKKPSGRKIRCVPRWTSQSSGSYLTESQEVAFGASRATVVCDGQTKPPRTFPGSLQSRLKHPYCDSITYNHSAFLRPGQAPRRATRFFASSATLCRVRISALSGTRNDSSAARGKEIPSPRPFAPEMHEFRCCTGLVRIALRCAAVLKRILRHRLNPVLRVIAALRIRDDNGETKTGHATIAVH